MAIGRSGGRLFGWRKKNRSHKRDVAHRRRQRRRQFLHEPLEHRLLLTGTSPTFTGIVGGQPDNPVLNDGEILLLATGPNPREVQFEEIHNVNAADTTNADQLQVGGSMGLDLTASSLTVGVWDGGAVRSSHQEFDNRVTIVDGASFHYHATHVGGTIGAAGVDPAAKGMATEVNIRSYDWTNDEAEMAADAHLVDLSNHSYGQIGGWAIMNPASFGLTTPTGLVDAWFDDRFLYDTEDPDFGKYSSGTRQWDDNLYNNPHLLSVWSAGNDRNDDFTNAAGNNQYVAWFSGDPGGIGFANPGWYLAPDGGATLAPGGDGDGGTGYDSLSPAQNAKNTLVVGAVDDVTIDPYSSPNIVTTSFSSYGPSDDGRVKPDVVGNGFDLYSPGDASDTAYLTMGGTSMSAPNVTGTAALLAEHYANVFGDMPSSATAKAYIIHTAADAGNVGPDYAHGWGLVNAADAATFLSNAATGADGDSLIEGVYNGMELAFDVVSAGVDPIKATIVWTDPPGAPQSDGLDVRTSVLVNDLELTITGDGGTTLFPWTLNPIAPASPAVRTSPNHVDNVEQVLIDSPSLGVHTIHVSATGNVPNQPFTLLISGADSGVKPTPPETEVPVAGPQLIAARPNEGELLLRGFDNQPLDVAPRELQLLFQGGANISPDQGNLAQGVRITRQGSDGQFDYSYAKTDFNTGGAVVLTLEAVKLGRTEDGVSVVFTKSDHATGVPTPVIEVLGKTINVDLNSEIGAETTAQVLVDAINAHPEAGQRVLATVTGNTAHVLTHNFASAASVKSNFDTDPSTGGWVEIEFTAASVGASGNRIQLVVNKSDHANDDMAPTISVVGDTITVDLNEQQGYITRAQVLVDAINNHPAAGSLVRARIAAGNFLADISTPLTNNTLLPLTGGHDGGDVNEVQQLTLGGAITGGSFTITYETDQTSAPIDWAPQNTLASRIQTALNAANMFDGNTLVESVSATEYTITFTGNLANANLEQITVDDTGVTGGSVTPSTVSDGARNEVQRVTLSDPATVTLSYDGVAATSSISASDTRLDVQDHLDTIPALTGNVTVIGADGGPFTVVFRNALAVQDVPRLDGTPAVGTVAFSVVADGGTQAPTAFAPLVLSGSGAAEATASFGIGGLEMLFRAASLGTAGNGIQVTVAASDLGAGNAPMVQVVESKITVTLNTNSQTPRTSAQDLADAINNDAVAGLLVDASIPLGDPLESISAATPTTLRLDGADEVITPGYIGLGETSSEVIVRFAETLPDDVYRLEVFGVDYANLGIQALRNTQGEAFTPHQAGQDRDAIDFELDLGAQIVSVVPQPVTRKIQVSMTRLPPDGDFQLIFQGERTADLNVFTVDAQEIQNELEALAQIEPGEVQVTGPALGPWEIAFFGRHVNLPLASLKSDELDIDIRYLSKFGQAADQVLVYFNDDDLLGGALPGSAEDAAFYRLVDTNGTAAVSDDVIRVPHNVDYYADQDLAVLTFDDDGNLGTPYRLPHATHRLEVGQADEANDTLATAIDVGTMFTTGFQYSGYLGDDAGSDNNAADVDLYRLQSGDVWLTGTTPVVTPSTVTAGTGNEVQTLTVSGLTDSFTLSYNGAYATSPLNAPFATLTASVVQANLNTIPALNGNVTVIGPDGGPFDIVFRNALASVNVSQLDATPSGSGTTAAVATTADGSGAGEVQKLEFDPSVTGGSFTITYGTNLTTGDIDWSATPGTLAGNIQTALDAIFGAGNTVVASQSATDYMITFTGNLANANVDEITTDPAGLSGGGVAPSTLSDGTGNEVQTLTVSGTADGFWLSYNGSFGFPSIDAPYTTLTASDVENTLNTIPALNGNVTVIGADAGPFTIVFRNALAGANVSQLETLPSGGGATATVGTTAHGGGNNEVQTLTVSGSADSFTLSYNSVNATSPIDAPYTALRASDVQDNLDTIAALTGKVSVVGPDGGPFAIVFGDTLAGTDVPFELVATPSGAGTTSTVSTVAEGNGVSEVQQLLFHPTVNGGTFTITYDGTLTTGDINWSANRGTLVGNIQTALNGIFGAGNTVVAADPDVSTVYTISFTGNLANADLDEITTDVSSLARNQLTPSTIGQGAGNEVQTLTLGGTDGGTVTLSYNGVSAAALTFAAGATPTAADVEARLDSINTTTPPLTGNVTVTGADGGPFTVVFNGALAGVNVSPLEAAAAGGTTATVSTSVDGFGDNEVQYLLFDPSVDGGSFTISYGANLTTANIAWDAGPYTLADNIQAALNDAAMFGANNTIVASESNTVYTITFTGNLAKADLDEITTDPALLTGTSPDVTPFTIVEGAGNEVQTLDVSGTTGDFTLSYAGTSAAAIDTATYPDYATLAATDVEGNLDTIGALTNNVTVIGADGGPFTIVFRNGLAERNVSPLGVAFTGNTTAAVAPVADGGGDHEVQKLAFDPSVTGGTFTITYGSNLTTGGITWDADPYTLAGNIQAALNDINMFGAGSTFVASQSNTEYTITFTGDLANADVDEITTDSTGLTGGSVAPSTLNDGIGNGVQTFAVSGSTGDFTLSYGGVPAASPIAASLPYSALPAAAVRANLETIPVLFGTAGNNLTVIGAVGGPFTVVFRNELADLDVSPLDATVTGDTTATLATLADGGHDNEVQQLTFDSSIDGGSFTIAYGTNLATGNIDWDATPSTLVTNIQTRLDTIFGGGIRSLRRSRAPSTR